MLSPPPGLSVAQWHHLLSMPAGTPPSGQISDLTARNPIQLAATISLVGMQFLVLLALLMRLYTQRYLNGGWSAGDYVMIVGWGLLVGACIGSSFCIHYGLGKHLWNVTLGGLLTIIESGHYTLIVFLMSVHFIRLAILLEFKRLFGIIRSSRIACWVCIIFNALFWGSYITVCCVRCSPHEKIFNPFIEGRCLDFVAFSSVAVILNAISGFAILMIPLPVLYRLTNGMQRRLSVLGLLGVGVLACASTIVRAYYTRHVFMVDDQTYYQFISSAWANAECYAAIFIFSFMVAPAFFQHIGINSKSWTLGLKFVKKTDVGDNSNSLADGSPDFQSHHE